MHHWLMKSEPDECSIDDALAARGRITPWTGVRNYQARNTMRDLMRIGGREQGLCRSDPIRPEEPVP
jgi:predicted RNA-binding protein with PUA-like domain